MDDPDRATLAQQYADAENLDARIALHEEYEVADRDWWHWVFDHYETLPAEADVLEAGCGPGMLWRDTADRVPPGWTLLLTDFSVGMAQEARATLGAAGITASLGVAAAEALPLPAASADAVIANHVLYHADRDAALPEIRRVLRPVGRLFATTNSETNLRELRDLLAATTGYESPAASAFSLETGAAQLEQYFETVHRNERGSVLRVPDLEPLVAYAGSLPAVEEERLAAFAHRAADRLADGPLEIHKRMGLFVAEKAP